jgi:hypothetical protein
VQLGVEISAMCSRDKFSTDPAVHASAVEEIRRHAGVHTDVLHEEVGRWVGFYGDEYTRMRAAALLDAFPGCVPHIALGIERRGAGGHGTFETSLPTGTNQRT